MSKKQGQRPASEWRELLNAEYDYPEEIENAGKRRVRRRARKAYRQEQREEVKRRLAEERRREPITPGGAILVIVAILAIGAAATHWWPDRTGAPSTVGHAGDSARTLDAEDDAPRPATTAPRAPEPSPSVKADRSKPEKASEGWARAYLTRNPVLDKTHIASVERAAPWMTDSLVANLKHFDDKAWGELVSNGGISKVDEVTVGPADDDRVRKQADTETRVWRKTSVDITVQGYRKYNETRVYLTEVMLTSDGWRVGRVLGV
ncbi:hypothetical protein [Streptomyces sp. ISL-11]|uniref:hypothetical protein n=1 Tax=Streptomyces sp. ISL-11 TaxID=2819174 RepID=UPI001BE7CD13|nr:hypothetical protein [Streptomyces sp. ISL-11]MBT2384057.1 hypothetical protein [Streptomyces sp. ISL-11]